MNQSYRAGTSIGDRYNRIIRLALDYVNGYAQDGQFVDNDWLYFGMAFYFRL